MVLRFLHDVKGEAIGDIWNDINHTLAIEVTWVREDGEVTYRHDLGKGICSQ
jgi:hypothetical protein